MDLSPTSPKPTRAVRGPAPAARAAGASEGTGGVPPAAASLPAPTVRPAPAGASAAPAKTRRVRYLAHLDQVLELTAEERRELRGVEEKFVFRTNEYYNSLIDWNDPDDPIRRIVIPDISEMVEGGRLDASNEEEVTVAPGLQHKYPHTALLLVNDVCGAYCRFCFRKRLFMDQNEEVVRDISAGVEYLRRTPAVTNVLLTGGDPLIMGTGRLAAILEELRTIPHVRIIRLGSKMPAFNPFRILDDPELPRVLRLHSRPHRRVYVMAHFNHPRELTPEAVEGLHVLQQAGVITVNQTPMIRGVNDSAEVLAELFRRLSFCGTPPYYVFQCRPTEGNDGFAVPMVEGYRHFEEAKRSVSGLAKRARFVMSHATGKIEILAVDRERIYLKYHRARSPADEGRFLVCRRDDRAAWLDDLLPRPGGEILGTTAAEVVGLPADGTTLRPRDRREIEAAGVPEI